MPKSVTLYYQEGSSDKVYQASMEAVDGGYVVNFAYGRRGNTLKTDTKTNKPVTLEEAEKIYDKLVASKRKKGYDYKPGEHGAVYTTADATDSGVRCQLLNPIDESEVAALIASPDWWAQPKHDGRRMLVKKAPDAGATAINRRGLVVGAPAGILASVEVSVEGFIVDGEAVGDTLYAFDFLDLLSDAHTPPYSDRLARLESMGFGPNVVVVETARTPAEKQEMYDRLRAEGAEGIVFKRHAAPYKPGRPNSGGDQVKFKFYNTASVRVTAHNEKRSVAITVDDETGGEIAVGNVTIPPNYDVPPVGSVVEVRYLYAYEGGSLYQPVYLGERDDVEVDIITELKFKAW